MLVPCLVVFALFIIWPLGKSVSLSLHGSDLFGRPDTYVGLQHYKDMLGSAEFRHILWVTFAFVLLTVVPGVLGALVVVLLLEQHIKGIRIFRTAFPRSAKSYSPSWPASLTTITAQRRRIIS